MGADALYRMLHADEVESFKKDQDAIIVGRFAQKIDDKFKVEVIKVISGTIASKQILVSEDFYYGWSEQLPQTSDYAVMSLKRYGRYYEKAWGIFKADGGNFKTLKLSQVNAKSPGLSADLACIQWYINSGGNEKDFSFENSNAYVRRPNGQVIQIYPLSSSKDVNITSAENSTDFIRQVEDANKTNKQQLIIYALIFSMVFLFSILIIKFAYNLIRG